MSQYYLLSQLPALEPYDGKGQMPITEERFQENCSRFLGAKEMAILNSISLIPPKEEKPSGSRLVDAWNHAERQLRLALAMVRAGKMGKTYSAVNEGIPSDVMQVASTAVDQADPMSAEDYLNRYRMDILNRIRPEDSFSEEAVYCYALRLKLLERIRLFDADRGRKSYQKIYTSILNGSGTGDKV